LQAEYDQASDTIYFYLSDRTGDCILRTTLLHEMVHIVVPEDEHGARFGLAEAGDEDAEYEVWRMVGDYAWDDAWVGEESGRWERYREGRTRRSGVVVQPASVVGPRHDHLDNASGPDSPSATATFRG
jgi:hypothetical protein